MDPSSVRRARRAGFGLLELTFALAVVAVALLGVMSMFVQASLLQRSQRELQIAKEAAAAVHEDLKAQTADRSRPVLAALQERLAARYGPPSTQIIDGRSCSVTTFAVPGLSWSSWTPSNGAAGRAGRGIVTLDPSQPQLVPVTIQIDWKSAGRGSGYSLTGMYAGGYFP